MLQRMAAKSPDLPRRRSAADVHFLPYQPPPFDGEMRGERVRHSSQEAWLGQKKWINAIKAHYKSEPISNKHNPNNEALGIGGFKMM